MLLECQMSTRLVKITETALFFYYRGENVTHIKLGLLFAMKVKLRLSAKIWKLLTNGLSEITPCMCYYVGYIFIIFHYDCVCVFVCIIVVFPTAGIVYYSC